MRIQFERNEIQNLYFQIHLRTFEHLSIWNIPLIALQSPFLREKQVLSIMSSTILTPLDIPQPCPMHFLTCSYLREFVVEMLLSIMAVNLIQSSVLL